MERRWKPTKKYWSAYNALYGEQLNPSAQAEMDIIRPVKKKKKRTYPERDLVHLPLMKRAKLHPLCRDYLLHIPNERKTSEWQGAMLKAMGVMAGVSDLFLAVPRNSFGGYWMELKAPGKKLKPEQAAFLSKMQLLGYKTGWFDNWQLAWASIEDYLGEAHGNVPHRT